MALRLNLACGPHHLPDFENLDKETGWRFEEGLPYPDDSVEGVTESHGLMFVPLEDWPYVFAEFARVLQPNGVIRITEDATDDPRSSRYGGFDGAVTLTSATLVKDHLRAAGLQPWDLNIAWTKYRDRSLCQAWHGTPPKVFFVEGIKP